MSILTDGNNTATNGNSDYLSDLYGVSDYDYSNYGSDIELDYETSSEDPDYFETDEDNDEEYDYLLALNNPSHKYIRKTIKANDDVQEPTNRKLESQSYMMTNMASFGAHF